MAKGIAKFVRQVKNTVKKVPVAKIAKVGLATAVGGPAAGLATAAKVSGVGKKIVPSGGTTMQPAVGGMAMLRPSYASGFTDPTQPPAFPGMVFPSPGGGSPAPGAGSMPNPGKSIAGFVEWLRTRLAGAELIQIIALVMSNPSPFQMTGKVLELWTAYNNDFSAPPGSPQLPAPSAPGMPGMPSTGPFNRPAVMVPEQVMRFKAPRGYVLVRHPDTGVVWAVDKALAKKYKLWKPAPKPAVSAADMRTLRKSGATLKKLERVIESTGQVRVQKKSFTRKSTSTPTKRKR